MNAPAFPIFTDGAWVRTSKRDWRARALADRHYPRQTPGAADFVPPGHSLVLVTPTCDAVWGVVENLDPGGTLRWRVTIFRNEGALRSSDLVREATERTRAFWRAHYGGEPAAPLTTEIDPRKVRAKRDPGRCFLRAGWRRVGLTAGGHGRTPLVVLAA